MKVSAHSIAHTLDTTVRGIAHDLVGVSSAFNPKPYTLTFLKANASLDFSALNAVDGLCVLTVEEVADKLETTTIIVEQPRYAFAVRAIAYEVSMEG